ncbi:MAG: hypothetical protein JSR97_09475 [Verrucomicrobia bacterium]|nr:hypothetical protein [Verrucomicrobiota bacterium]
MSAQIHISNFVLAFLHRKRIRQDALLAHKSCSSGEVEFYRHRFLQRSLDRKKAHFTMQAFCKNELTVRKSSPAIQTENFRVKLSPSSTQLEI